MVHMQLDWYNYCNNHATIRAKCANSNNLHIVGNSNIHTR